MVSGAGLSVFGAPKRFFGVSVYHWGLNILVEVTLVRDLVGPLEAHLSY